MRRRGETERERENETALRSALFLDELSSASHAAPREKTNEGSAHLVRLYNVGKYDKWGVSFPTFLTEIFLFCVPEPTLSHSRVDTQKEEHAPGPEDFLDSRQFFWTRFFSLFLCRDFFFTRAHTLQSSRAHRRGHKTRGSPAEEEEEEEEEEEGTDPRRPEDEDDDDDDDGGGGDARHQGLED